jgi:peptidoglycan hydrolase-like protein with peptidoglycan-binding domain
MPKNVQAWNESQFLASKITQNQLQTVIDGVSEFEARLDSPMWGDFLGTLAYPSPLLPLTIRVAR